MLIIVQITTEQGRYCLLH